MATSQRASKSALAAARGGIAKFDVFAMRFHGIIVIEPYHVLPLIKDERRTSGKGNGALASIRSKLMLTCSTFCHCITNKPNQIPPILRIERDIATSGGAS
jgi:hypothetical protein